MAAADGTPPRQPLPQSLPEAAAWYVTNRTRVFPLYGVHDGVCDCGNPECGSPGKHPRTEHGFQDASSDPVQVAEWWSRWPNANIGMPTGIQTGVLVVDVDPRHGGRESLQALMDAHGGFPLTPEVRTGSGGSHYYFKAPYPCPGNSANLLGKGIDTRGEGGYVAMPPSRHVSGGIYQWVTQDTRAPVEPPWMAETLARTNGHGGPGADGVPPRIDVATVLAGVPEGQRDDQLFRVASKLRYADVPYEAAEELLLRAAANCVPPFPIEVARAKVAYVYAKYEATLPDPLAGETETVALIGEDAVRVVTNTDKGPIEIIFQSLEKGTRDLDAEMTLRFLMPGTHTHPYHQRINLLSMSARESCRRELEAIYGKDIKWAKLLSDACATTHETYLSVDRSQHTPNIAIMEAVEMMIAGIAPAQGTTILFGGGSAAKTFLAMSMAICVSKGIPFMGRATQQRKVMFVDYETGPEMFAFRVGRLLRGLGYDKTDGEGIYYWDGAGVPLLDCAEAVRHAAERHGCGLLVVDHAALACGTEPEKSEAALKVKRALARIKLPTLLVAHVTGDGEINPNLVQRPFGSVFWSNLARRTWYVNRVQEQESDTAEVGLYCRKNNDGRRPLDFALQLCFEAENGPITLVPADLRATPRLVQGQHIEERLWAALEEPMTVAELKEITGLSESSIKHTLASHPRRFVNQTGPEGGRGRAAIWARLGLL